MGRLIFLLFLIVPLIEIGLFIVVGQAIGLLPTLLGVLVTAMIGSWIIRRQGVSLLFEAQRLTGHGQLPARQMAEGVMLAVAGALLLTPGYFTDTVGFVLLVPPIRHLIYEWLKSRVVVTGFSTGPGGFDPQGPRDPRDPRRQGGPDVIDLDQSDWRGGN